jgi:hypothetical protein
LKRALYASAALLLCAGPVHAEPQLPQPAPATPPIAAPRDIPYAGTLKLQVDATDLERRIFRIHESVPVSGPGPFTLLFPKWVPA